MGKTTNVIYPNQVALLAFIASITFKVVMLPQYLAGDAGRAAPIAMAYLMAIEVMEFVIIYGVIKRTSLLQAHIPEALKAVFILLVAASSYFKTVVLSAEAVSYISGTLFDNGLWRLIVLAYMPCLVYISYKGGNVLARTAQIVFWFIAVSLLFNVLFAHFNGDIGNLMPVRFSGEVMKACDRHLVWFGDFTPFLFLTVARPAKPQKVRLPVMIGLCFAAAVAFAGGCEHPPLQQAIPGAKTKGSPRSLYTKICSAPARAYSLGGRVFLFYFSFCLLVRCAAGD